MLGRQRAPLWSATADARPKGPRRHGFDLRTLFARSGPARSSCRFAAGESASAVHGKDKHLHGRRARSGQHREPASGVLGAPPRSAASSGGVLPNWSLEWTSTGVALGPRGARCHHPPRGPSTTPVPAPQLKR